METQQNLTAEQAAMLQVWQQHLFAELVQKDPEGALSTMVEDPYVLMVPTGLGGFGRDGVRAFYEERFIPDMPADIQSTAISQVIGHERLVDESLFTFTHDREMKWLLPGVPGTGRQVRFSVVSIVLFRDGKIASEHLHFDHASLLLQLGLLKDPGNLSIGGTRAADKLLATMSSASSRS